jgi:Ca-activated chloride channel family protein
MTDKEGALADSSLGRRVFDALTPYLITLGVALPFVVYLTLTLRGSDIRWAHRGAFLLLLAIPLGAWIAFHLEPRRAGTLSFARIHDLRRTRRGWVGHLLPLPRALRLCAVGLIAVALAQPQRMSTDPQEVEGIDIVVALDVSASMDGHDLLPNRIGAAKQVIEDFIERRPSDRIGLVIFGREAFTQCPLTLDHRALSSLLAEVDLGLVDGRGTAIGNALGTAINRLRRSTAKSRVIVLVTDGDDNASQIDPRQAAKFAQSFGIKVFTILIGREKGGDDPVGTDRFGNIVVRRKPADPVNPRLLEEIADQTGGVPYLATDKVALQQRFQAILEDLDRSRLKAQTPHYAELYPQLIIPALALILVEVLLSLTRFRRFP